MNEKLLLWLIAVASCITATFVMFVATAGPPTRCAYLVAVVGHPGVYTCSSHSHPVKL